MSGVAVVTGASSGIGRAISVHLARRPGMRVIAVARRAEALRETSALAAPGTVLPVAADVTTRAGRAKVIEAVRESGAKVQMLIQNAGTIGPIAPAVGKGPSANDVDVAAREAVELQAEKEWRDTFELNVHAPLFLVRALAAAGLFDDIRGARVLHMGSGAAHKVMDGCAAYCSSKSAFLMMARCLQSELSDHGVKLTVGSMQPGVVESPMQQVIRSVSPDDMSNVEFFHQLKANEFNESEAYQTARAAEGGLPPLAPPHYPPTDGLDTADNVAHFCNWLLNDTSAEEFAAKEWDIRDCTHWAKWISGNVDK